MKKACRNRITTWGMMGLLVVGLNVWFALPARAVPIDYTLNGVSAVGGFTLDDTQAAPYITWNITAVGLNFNNLTDDAVIVNTEAQIGTFSLETESNNGIRFELENIFFPGGQTRCGLFIFNPGIAILLQEQCTLSLSNNIPEPPHGVLLLIGLLVLAGARWWTHRQERLQVG